ncbi:MAG: valine--pyruvate transaminase [Gammaproteobacteria bacterium]|nr:valine--pyruvate transaminase [Gammaproteobacteria bacterium]
MKVATTDFGRRILRPTGALELMTDLGEASIPVPGRTAHMLGGGNPARIPAVEDAYRRRLREIAEDDAQFGRFAATYSAPGGDRSFRGGVAEMLARKYGWPLTERNVALTCGSQTAFTVLFNLFAGECADGSRRRILFPLAPEYIGYADVGLSDDMLVAQRADIEELPGGFFKYHVRFEGLDRIPDVGAICVSRPTNPSGNVLTLGELERLDALARARAVPFIIDAAYGYPFPGIQFEEPGLIWNDNVVLCLSLSKLGLPATRTGIVVANEDVIEALTAFNATASLAPVSTGAVIVDPLLRSGELERICDESIRPYYAERSREAVAWLQDAFRDLPLRIHRPEGAFFLWLWFPGLPITSAELYRRLKARGVFVLSGHHFFPGLEDDWRHRHECIRLNYSQARESVAAGVKVIAEEVGRAKR